MKRSDLEKKAISILEKNGYECERASNKAVFAPGKGYVARRFDFFHVVDIIALRGSEIRFIQVMSEDADPESKHHSSSGSDSVYLHRKKIEKIWKFSIPVELWVYAKKKGKWILSAMVYEREYGWLEIINPLKTGGVLAEAIK